MMELKHYCPNCEHEFCLECLKRTWAKPVGTAVYRKVGNPNDPDRKLAVAADIVWYCCACKKDNLAAHWKAEKISPPKAKPTHPDLFEPGETKG